MTGVEIGGVVGLAFALVRILERAMDAALKRRHSTNGLSRVDHALLVEMAAVRSGVERMEHMLGRVLDRLAAGGDSGRRFS